MNKLARITTDEDFKKLESLVNPMLETAAKQGNFDFIYGSIMTIAAIADINEVALIGLVATVQQTVQRAAAYKIETLKYLLSDIGLSEDIIKEIIARNKNGQA